MFWLVVCDGMEESFVVWIFKKMEWNGTWWNVFHLILSNPLSFFPVYKMESPILIILLHNYPLDFIFHRIY